MKMQYGLWTIPCRSGNYRTSPPENLEVARRVARKSTLVRDRVALIAPLAGADPLIWPAELENSRLYGWAWPLEPHLLSLGASEAETGTLFDSLRGSPLVLAGTYNLQCYPAWAGLINTLAEETEVALLALSAYDILAAPAAGTYLCTYSNSIPSMQALAEVLNGAITPRGNLPVELPGLD